MAAAGKSAKKEIKKYIPVKTSFTSPFTPKWAPLPQEDMHFILKTLKDKLVSTGLEKKEVKVFRPWRKKKDQKPAATADLVPQDGQVQDAPKTMSQDGKVQDSPKTMSQDGLVQDSPKTVSQDGQVQDSPKTMSQDGKVQVSPKTMSQDGKVQDSPKTMSQDGKVQDSPKTMSQDGLVQDSPKNGWTDVAARRQLAIGVNEVTKALERNELKLLLVCKSVKPPHMTDHLIALSATRGVPACQVPRLSESVSEPLGLKSVLALGFRQCASKEDEVFTDAVEAITLRVPSVDVAWLQGAAPRVTPEDPIDMEEEVSEKRGQKRKLESEPEEVGEAAFSCTLQPLKVKKVVANPAKKRKKLKSKPVK